MDCPIKIVEFCCAVKNEILKKFRTTHQNRLGNDFVKGQGKLNGWFIAGETEVGWNEGMEHEKITIVGMEDIF